MKDTIPVVSIPRNELIQWVFIGITVGVGIITFIAMRHQIKLNKMQIQQLENEQHQLHQQL